MVLDPIKTVTKGKHLIQVREYNPGKNALSRIRKIEGDPMKLQFNNNSELWFPDFGIYKPKQVVEVNDELIAKKMLSTGYFKEVKKRKPVKIKIKKSKKGDSWKNSIKIEHG